MASRFSQYSTEQSQRKKGFFRKKKPYIGERHRQYTAIFQKRPGQESVSVHEEYANAS
jgi:hypothetical protein